MGMRQRFSKDFKLEAVRLLELGQNHWQGTLAAPPAMTAQRWARLDPRHPAMAKIRFILNRRR